MRDNRQELPDQERAAAIVLSPRDQARFVAMLMNPPALSPAMERALEAHRRLIRNSVNR